MSIQPEIIKTFQVRAGDSDVVRELESLCNIYSLTPEKLRIKWEAFALTSQCDLTPTINYVRILKNSLQREFDRGLKQRRTIKGKVATKRGNGIDFSEYNVGASTKQEDPLESFMSNLFTTKPTVKKQPVRQTLDNVDTKISENSAKFSERSTPHTIDLQYKGSLPLPTKDHNNDMDMIDHKFSFGYTQEQIKPYRYMFEKIKETSETMDERIDYVGSLIQEAHGIEVFANPTRVGQEAVYAYGLICSDASEVRLSANSVILQTSRDLGMGGRIPLDLAKVDGYTLFPGQVIGVKGTNHGGRAFQVDEILMPPSADKDHHGIMENKTLDMIVACGPFTLSSDLSFKPLEELLDMCQQQQPDIILLSGPFLSVHHPFIASGQLNLLPESIIAEQVIARLVTLLETCTETNVFLMPHANDITHTYNLFPQPRFENMNISHERIHLVSNPSSLVINGHTVTMANVDTIFRLGREEISKNPEQGDRFSRLVEHILQQHTLYPLSPVALDDNIDSDKMVDLHVSMAPDILILPSQLKHFVKNVQGTVCINPGFLCKNQTGGTYARVIMYPQEEERVRVDLKKL